MKKTIRVVTSLLALLALLVSLPICAMAEDYDGSEPISGNVGIGTKCGF